VDGKRLGLAGYSFGAGVAFPVGCADARVKAQALVSPYFESSPLLLLKGCMKPKTYWEAARMTWCLPVKWKDMGRRRWSLKSARLSKVGPLLGRL
jgi:dienelactone hydrolase